MDTSSFFEAIESGDRDAVERLLDADPRLAGARRADGLSPILVARYGGQTAVVARLRAATPALDVFDAAAVGDGTRLRELLGADPSLASARSADGFTALHYAAFFGGAEAARALLDAGAEVDARAGNEMQVMPLHSAVAGRIEVAMLLIEAGADVNVRQRHGWAPLHGAADHGDLPVVEALLARGADPKGVTDDGLTPADAARAKGHAAVAERLERAAAGTGS